MADETGASHAEQIIEATRRNNVDLLNEVFEDLTDTEQRAKVINEARDPIGNSPLHLAALNGNFEVVDIILDQEGVEVDPVNSMEGDTPLHCCVKYSKDEPEHGVFMAEVFIDAGGDPRIKNKFNQKPIELCDQENTEMINVLRASEYAMMMGKTRAREQVEEEGEVGEKKLEGLNVDGGDGDDDVATDSE